MTAAARLTVEQVKLGQLRAYPGNARRGDVDAIAESLRVNGQYRPLVVQRSTGYVLGGNHTLQAAQRLGWPSVQVTYLDVNDEEARRIVVADNRTADLGGYDDRALLTLLREVGDDLTGTGYDLDDYDELLAALEQADADSPPQEPTVLLTDPPAAADGPAAGGAPAEPGTARQAPSTAEYESAYGTGGTRFLALTFTPARYAWLVQRMAALAADRGADSDSDLILSLVAEAAGQIPPAADAEVPAAELAAAEELAASRAGSAL